MFSMLGGGKKTTASSAAAGGAGVSASASSSASGAKAAKNSLCGARRRLSVVSDNKLIEGIATLGAVDVEDTTGRAGDSIVRAFAGVSKKGYAPYNPRKRNQDAIIMEEHKPTGTFIFGVCDGHGEAGDLVSHYFSDRLPPKLVANAKFATDTGVALADEIAKLETALLADASIDTEFSGTTAVIGTLRKRTLTVANIGDSRVIIGRKETGGSGSSAAAGGAGGRSAAAGAGSGAGIVAVPVTDDHKPDRPDEEKRIVARGGRVFAVEYEDGIDGPPRVWLGHMDIPGLAMSRSLGDTVAHTAGVISEPEMHTVELGEADKVLVWASDGLWEFMKNQEVLDLITAVNPAMDDPKKCVDALVAEANKRWMAEEQVIDDTTVIVVFLN